MIPFNKIPVPVRLIELHPFVSSTSMIWPAVCPSSPHSLRTDTLHFDPSPSQCVSTYDVVVQRGEQEVLQPLKVTSHQV